MKPHIRVKSYVERKIEDICSFVRENIETVKIQTKGKKNDSLSPKELVSVISNVMFQDLGFYGNVQEYYSPSNSFINSVLDKCSGIPITLSVLFKMIADRIGLETFPVSFPSHFLLGVKSKEEDFFIDSYNGGKILNKTDCQQMLEGSIEWSDEFLTEANFLLVYVRMLNNLVGIYREQDPVCFVNTLDLLYELAYTDEARMEVSIMQIQTCLMVNLHQKALETLQRSEVVSHLQIENVRQLEKDIKEKLLREEVMVVKDSSKVEKEIKFKIGEIVVFSDVNHVVVGWDSTPNISLFEFRHSRSSEPHYLILPGFKFFNFML